MFQVVVNGVFFIEKNAISVLDRLFYLPSFNKDVSHAVSKLKFLKYFLYNLENLEF